MSATVIEREVWSDPVAPAKSWVDGHNLVEQLIRDQKSLQTAVARFSAWHDREVPELESHYRKLIPLEKPGPGEQYAFEVNVEGCSGCKACVSACHSLNGLETDETWRDVGNLTGGTEWDPVVQTITTACHHCIEPGCLEGCPVLAYHKDEATGIVRHLDDQCIGCQYCVLKCPYDVPKYSESGGIVRKCDLCQDRLSAGEAPACVQACPNEAIRIVTVNQDEAHATGENAGKRLLPSTVASSYTLPTTRYLGVIESVEGQPEAEFADRHRLREEPAHFALVVMLVLTQAGTGSMAAALMTHCLGLGSPLWLLVAGILLSGLGANAAVFHLGRPLKAWRAFLGWRTSWLSREIISFGVLLLLSFVVTVLASAQIVPFTSRIVSAIPEATVLSGAMWILVLVALLSVGTSVMVYADTRRPFWSFPRTGFRFYGSVMVLGAAAGMVATQDEVFFRVGAVALAAKLGAELWFLRRRWLKSDSKLDLSAHLMCGPLKRVTVIRYILAVAAGAVWLYQPVSAAFLLLLSEGCERYLFFRSVVAWRMPGV